MILSIAWKEYREQRIIWLTMALVTAAAIYAGVTLVFPSGFESQDHDKIINLMLVTVGLVATYGLVCGATLLAGEHESRTLVWLDNLTGLRSGVWFSKLFAGVLMSVAQGLVLAGVLYYLRVRLPNFDELNWFWAMPAAAVEALAWGLFTSSFCRSALPAAGLASLPLAFSWGVGTAIWAGSPPISVAVRLVILLVALGFSWFIFCGEDIGRFGPLLAEPVPTRGRRGTARSRKRPKANHGPFRSLLWLTWRQGKRAAITLGIIALIWGWLLPYGSLILWPFGTLVMGVVFGMATFFDEQSNDSARFLGDHRLPLGYVWGVKMAFWLVVAFLVVDVSFVSGLFHMFTLSWSGRSLASTDVGRGFDQDLHLLETMGFLPYLMLWFFYGFSVSQLCVVLFRKGAVALVVATGVSAGLATLWVPSLVFGGLHLWQVLTGPLLLLLASRLLMWSWVSDRLYTPRPLITLGACLVASALWLAANIGYRVVELPDVGEPFAVQAFVASLPKVEDNHAGNAIRQAGRELREWEQQVDLQFAEREAPRGRPLRGRMGGGGAGGPGMQPGMPPGVMPPPLGPQPGVPVPQEPQGGPPQFPGGPPDGGAMGIQEMPPPFVDAEQQRNFQQLISDVLEKGWSVATPEFSRRIDALFGEGWANFDLFQSTWVDRLRAMNRLPLGVVENPKDISRFSTNVFETIQRCRQMASFLQVRSLQLQARGKHEESLECLVLQLALARNLRNKTAAFVYMAGVGIEAAALEGLDSWLQGLGPRPDLLRRALAELNRHEREQPPVSDMVKGEYLVSRNTFINAPFFSQMGFGTDLRDSLAGARNEILTTSAQVPWEKLRQERLLSAVYAGWVRAAETEPWDLIALATAARQEGRRDGRIARAERALEGWLPAPDGPGVGLSRERLAGLVAHSWLSDFLTDTMPMLELGTTSQCRVGGARLKAALALYQAANGRAAPGLENLREILPDLPIDPYSGESFRYRVSRGERLDMVQSGVLVPEQVSVAPGQGVLWSIGPDQTDHGGRRQGARFPSNDHASWAANQFDWIFVVPRWRK